MVASRVGPKCQAVLTPHALQVETQLFETSEENAQLRSELARLEAQNNNMQGYNLDGMSGTELSRLIRSLTQAVERVRVTVQMRRLADPSPEAYPAATPSLTPRAPSSTGSPANRQQSPQGGTPPATPSPDATSHADLRPSLRPGQPRLCSAPPSGAHFGTTEQPPCGVERYTARDLTSQEYDELHRAVPLRRPKKYTYSPA